MSSLLLATLLVLPQDPESAPAAPGGDGWRPVDAVIFQAGDEAITNFEVMMHFDSVRRRADLTITNDADKIRYLNLSLESLVTIALESQAGEDREQDPIGLEDRVDKFLASRRANQPAVDYVESLEQAGLSAQAERELNKTSYYKSSFRNQGKIGPRPTRDDHIRPGELREYYRTSSLALLGGESSYRFQDLVVRVDQTSGVAEAQALVEELRARLLDGADFGELHDVYGMTEQATRGLTEMFGPENPLPDREAVRFGELGEVGDISPVMAIDDPRRPGEIAAFRVLRLYEKIPGTPAPPFATAQAQDAIRTWAEEQRDKAWLANAHARLHRAAYLWPDPADRREETAPVPPASVDQAEEDAAEGASEPEEAGSADADAGTDADAGSTAKTDER